MQRNKATRKIWGNLINGICMILLTIGFLCLYAGRWYLMTYGELGFDSILYTLTAGMQGVQVGLIVSFAKDVLLRLAIAVFVSWFLLFPYTHKVQIVLTLGKKFRICLMPIRRSVAVTISLVMTVSMVSVAAVETEFTKLMYYGSIFSEPSTFYEDNFVDTEHTEITFPEQKRNLIFIFLESMETAFFSQEEHGALEVNVVPELYQLAQENLNFSHNDSVGGFAATSGTTWTMGGILAQTAGIPMKTPMGKGYNNYGIEEAFMPGVYTLSNILDENGYNQSVMLGSDARFCGRYRYYMDHGIDQVYDYYTAMDDGIIPEGYHVWWGMEDAYLYEYAQQELLNLADGDQPFSFSMLTVDTHHIGGYVCKYCQTEHAEQYENVYRCASKQLYNFLLWLQQQDFYENTTIVITGDHPSMDAEYFSRRVSTDYDRRVYNCFINAVPEPVNTKNRQFSGMDIFPTVLAAMGCSIDGDQLGMGVNLFSEKPTLMEQMDWETFDLELSRYSEFYVKKFF